MSNPLVARLKAKIGAFSNSSKQKSSTQGDFSLTHLYRLIFAFKDDRRSYTDGLAYYADVLRTHQGVAGALFRDEAYYRLTRAADHLLQSLDAFTVYVKGAGLAKYRDTAALDRTLEQLIGGKGNELHSISDNLRSNGLTSDDLTCLAAEAAANGKTLDSQIQELQQMLFEKGAKAEPFHIPN